MPRTGPGPGRPTTNNNNNSSAPRGNATATPSTSDKPHYPLPKTYAVTDEFGVDRGSHIHEGVDYACPEGTNILATKDGKLTRLEDPSGYGHYVTVDHANNEKTIYGHLSAFTIASGTTVKKGEIIAKSGNTGSSTGAHLHFQVEKNGTPVDPELWLDGAETGAGTGGDPGSTATSADLGALAKSTAFATFINFPGILTDQASLALRGERSLMNDQKLLPFIEQLCGASLRSFQSLPNGAFFAFFPDYFGGLNHRTPYWSISDLETIDATMDLSDDALATHVYVVGDTNATFDPVNLLDMQQSSGVVTLFTAFQADFLSGAPVGANKVSGTESKESDPKVPDSMIQKDQAIAFLQKYGARPHYEAAQMIQSPYFEAFLAYQRFMLLWSKQFITTFTFTYMPELFPGGIIEFEAHGIQCYIDEVEHTCDYAEGFVTRAVLSAPAAIGKRDAAGKTVRSGRTGAHEGMIRAGAIGRPTGTGE